MIRLHWIDTRANAQLAVSARPRGGEALEEDVAAWASEGVCVVTSLLSEPEVRELELEHAPEVCASHGIQLVRLPIADMGVLSIDEALCERLGQLARHAANEEPVLMHCRMGIGRATMLAVAVLAHLGQHPDEAWPRVREARGCAVPDTQTQYYWTLEYATHIDEQRRRAESELDNLFG